MNVMRVGRLAHGAPHGSRRARHGGLAPKMTRKLSPQTSEHVAHHEAGHFVADYFHATYERIDAVTIVPSGDAAGQNTGRHPLDEGCSNSEIAKAIIGLFAGRAAEVRYDASREIEARSSAGDDEEKAATFLRWLCHGKGKRKRDDLEMRLRARAASLVEEHWAAVSALARELLERKKLDVYEAAWIVAIAEGEDAKTRLAEYRSFRDGPARRVVTMTRAELRGILAKAERQKTRAARTRGGGASLVKAARKP